MLKLVSVVELLFRREAGAKCVQNPQTNLAANQAIATVATYFKTSPSSYQAKRSTAAGRDLAAYLAHRQTIATRRELATALGLSNPDSVSNMIRRAEIAISASKSQRQDLERIESCYENCKQGLTPKITNSRIWTRAS